MRAMAGLVRGVEGVALGSAETSLAPKFRGRDGPRWIEYLSAIQARRVDIESSGKILWKMLRTPVDYWKVDE